MRHIQISRKYEKLKFVIAHDVGCDDFIKAALNRYRIATGYATDWWKRMESERGKAAQDEGNKLLRAFTLIVSSVGNKLGNLF